jgi:hypothetical protein
MALKKKKRAVVGARGLNVSVTGEVLFMLAYVMGTDQT